MDPEPGYFLRWRIFARIRRFLRPILRRPLPVFFVPTPGLHMQGVFRQTAVCPHKKASRQSNMAASPGTRAWTTIFCRHATREEVTRSSQPAKSRLVFPSAGVAQARRASSLNGTEN